MSLYPYGKAALSILILALISGISILFMPSPTSNATLTYWCFATPHYNAYKAAIPIFEKEHPGVTINLQQVSNTALAARLEASMLANVDVPDCCELEISQAGTMFRGPVKDIGFINLKPYLIQSGLYNVVPHARFAPYTSRGEIFGMPHDVHPEQMAYNATIFAKYHIDPNSIKTWDDFIRVGHEITIPRQQYMLEASASDSTQLEAVLLQRGGGYFDPQGNCTMDNDIAVQSVEFYVPLVAGKDPIGSAVGDMFGANFGKALDSGYNVCFMTPDWRTRNFQDNFPEMSGKMALMPFPAVYPGGRRTSTWGGTMVGITTQCKNPQLAWQLIQFFYTDPTMLSDHFQKLNILPPVSTVWKQPIYSKPNPYWSNEPLGALYAKLAPEVPAQYTSPEITTAKGELSNALIDCVAYYNNHEDNESGFDAYVRQDLKEHADRVRALMARTPF